MPDGGEEERLGGLGRPRSGIAGSPRFQSWASRTPAPPPFSGINLTPAFSRALVIASIVRSCADKSAAQIPSLGGSQFLS
jgi:hypothetical protein